MDGTEQAGRRDGTLTVVLTAAGMLLLTCGILIVQSRRWLGVLLLIAAVALLLANVLRLLATRRSPPFS